jgi:hypothetical protein
MLLSPIVWDHGFVFPHFNFRISFGFGADESPEIADSEATLKGILQIADVNAMPNSVFLGGRAEKLILLEYDDSK